MHEESESRTAQHPSSVLALAASLAFFFIVGTYSLRQPGLQYDEAFDAIPALQVLQGERPDCAGTFRLAGVHLPAMIHPHIGPTSAYTSLAGFALFGASVETLRVSQLAVGALALVLLFALARRWLDARTAALAALLCGTAPAFIWWSRGGANWTVPLLPLALGMLLALDRWWRTGHPAALAAAGLLAGFGVTTKILFVWFALPMLLTGLLAIGPRRIAAAARASPRSLLFGLLGLLAGLGFLIDHNTPRPHTWEHIVHGAGTTAWGHDNRDVVGNLGRVLSYFLRMLDGDVSMDAPLGGLAIGGAVFVAALVYGSARVAAALGGRSVAARERLVPWTFLVLVPVTVLPQSVFTTSALGATYHFAIVPFAWLLVAAALGEVLGAPAAARPRRAARIAAGGLLVAVLWSHVAANVELLGFFATTGGRGHWSDAVERVAAALERRPERPVVALDWGFARNIELLTERRVRVIEGHEFLPAPTEGYAERCRELLAIPGALFLVHDESFALCRGCFDVSREAARAAERRLVRVEQIRDGEGRVHTEIYEAVPREG